MKTFIINGATNPHGDTAALLDAFRSALAGEVIELDRKSGVSPCVDCRRCLSERGCAIRDGMTECYDYIAECDLIVIASPIWFESLSGPTLDIASRVQTLFAASHFRGEPPSSRGRRGVVLLACGRPGGDTAARRSAELMLRTMGVRSEDVTFVVSDSTDTLPAKDDASALEAARRAALGK